jgi:hypothetical protein
MELVQLECSTIPDAWFQCISKVIDVGFKYEIEHGSYVGQTRLEFDFITVYIKHPYTEPYDLMLPEIPAHLNIPNPVENGYVEQYLPYLMTGEKKEGEDYTYGQRLVKVDMGEYYADQVHHWINLLKKTPNTNQAVLQIAQPSDSNLDDPPCLHGDSEIVTINGFKKIRDIQIGDLVLTHKNRWREVADVGAKKYNGTIQKVGLQRRNKELLITPNHELYGFNIEKCPYKNVGNLKCKPNCKRQHTFKNGCKALYHKYTPGWKASSLCDDSFFSMVPIIQDVRKSRYSINQMWLFGLFLAEGDYSKEDGIRFNLDEKRTDLHEKVITIMMDEYSLEPHFDHSGQSVNRISFYSRPLTKKFLLMFSKGARTKKFPSTFVLYNPILLASFLDGFNSGDGYNRQRGNGIEYSIYTTSLALRNLFELILSKLNYTFSIHYHKKIPDGNINGRIIKANGPGYNIVYRVTIEKEKISWNDNLYYYLPIKSNLEEKFDDMVYNISVDEDNSYVANGITVKNCLRHIDMRIKDDRLIFYPYFRCIEESHRIVYKNSKGIIHYKPLKDLHKEVTSGNTIHILSFDIKNKIPVWGKVKKSVRRKASNLLNFNIGTTGNLLMTEEHWVFNPTICNKKGFKLMQAKDIQIDDQFVAVQDISNLHSNVQEYHDINLVKLLQNENNIMVKNVTLKDIRKLCVNPIKNWEESKKIPLEEIDKINEIPPYAKLSYYGGIKTHNQMLQLHPKLGYIFGAFLANGSFRNSGIEIALGRNRKKIIINKLKDALNCIKMKFTIEKYDPSVYRFYFGDKFFTIVMCELGFVQGSHNKYIPEFIFNTTKEFKKQVVEGWLDGDSGCSVSLKLVEDMRIISALAGQDLSLYTEKARDTHFHGGVVHSSPSYRGYKKTTTKDNIRKHGIKNIKKVDEEKFVVDIAVEEYENFCIGRTIVHNSWDLWGGFPANLAGIAVLQKHMADEIGVTSGPIVASSKGLHIYGYCEELAKLRTGK